MTSGHDKQSAAGQGAWWWSQSTCSANKTIISKGLIEPVAGRKTTEQAAHRKDSCS